ncbi:MAG: ATP-binding protein [Bacteroidetes bacterium]|nr:ATP-binding protein [Bacteroidota bacterium]MBU1717791.1 ATP-binding protein [Bacteroidota bacterium]
MKSKKISNPFPVTAYYGKDYFCDRVAETSTLISNMQNGVSTTLISIRRIGKTGLIQHVLASMPVGWKGIYVDILDTENLNQFLNKIATSILAAIPEKSKPGKKIWNFFKSLRPVISFDPLSGSPQVSFDMKQRDVESGIMSVFDILEDQDFRVLIAIDEFQQILSYPEGSVDAWLRSKIQLMKNVHFVFSGSQQHLMADLFASPARPFFRSTQIMKLQKIDKEMYRNFIISLFRKGNKEMSPEIANAILEWAEIHTFYVQQLCNRVYAVTEKKVSDDLWKTQAFGLLKEQETMFYAFRNILTRSQWQLIRGIAQEGIVYQPSSKAFINKHRLGSSASIHRSLGALLGYELVYKDYDSSGKLYYSVYDVFFKRWCQDQ